MDCKSIENQLGLFLDGELSETERTAVEHHLGSCPECQQELSTLESLAKVVADSQPVEVPPGLWDAVEQGLSGSENLPKTVASDRALRIRIFRRPLAAAASVLIVVSLAALGIVWLQGTTPTAHAASVDFGALMDAVSIDARAAFQDFLAKYSAQEIDPDEAKTRAPKLDFEVPPDLPGGFQRTAVHVLRFGNNPGIAAEYRGTDGAFLAALFHRPVVREDYGTYKDYPCVIGEHRGHTVESGDWRLVHLTDPSTCHCVLSKLDPEKDLPSIMAAVAPRSEPGEGHGDHHHGD